MPGMATRRRWVLFGAPTLLGLLEIGHPALLPHDDIVATIAPIATWWTVLHILQVPLFALLGIAVFLLVRDLGGCAAAISRGAIAIFIVVYPAYDAAVGIASGILVTAGVPADLEPALYDLFWGPVTGLMAITGAGAWLVALLAAAWAWRTHGAPRTSVICLGLSGILLGIAHIRPFGPLACLSFLIGAVLIEFRANVAPTT